MQRFSASDAKYSYSPDHASIGTVEAGERFEVESVEGFSGYFRSPSDFTPEVYAEAEAHKWAVTGPISVAGAKANGAVAMTIRSRGGTTRARASSTRCRTGSCASTSGRASRRGR